MASKIKVDQIEGSTGTTVSLPSGQTLDLSSGSVTLPNTSVSNAQLAGSIDLSTKVTGTLASGNLPTIPVAKGGTGLTSLGTAGQAIKVATGGSTLEFGDVSSTNNVQQTFKTDHPTFASNSSWNSISGYNVTITPTSTNSKILLFVTGAGTCDTYHHIFNLKVERQISGGSNTFIGEGATGGSAGLTGTTGNHRGEHDSNSAGHWSFVILDTPNTTSAITYQVYGTTNQGTTWYLNHTDSQSYTTSSYSGGTSQITAWEVLQ